jgi:hypothetical protein
MFSFQPAHGLALTLAVACCTVAAQPSAAPAAAASAAYLSVFDSYQPFADEKIAPWKASNDTVGKVGGWRAYAREAAGAAPATGSAPAPAPAPGQAPGAAPAAAPGHKH